MKQNIGLWWLLLLLIACSQQEEVLPSEPTDIDAPQGFTVRRLVEGLRGPTQFQLVADDLWVAQINGGENRVQGQIVVVDLVSGTQRIFWEGLDKPTGLAVTEEWVWVATRDQLLRRPREGGGDVEVVLNDMPNNGRSNGTLTLTTQNQLIYETSGNRRSADSGKLWAIDIDSLAVTELATGLKGGYAHVEDDMGRIWLTEIADGSVGGVTLPDELNLLVEGADFGWPRCYGRELAGPDCDGVRPAVAVFPAQATPTSVALSPFDEDRLFVTLWVSGEVVEIILTPDGDNAIGEVRSFLSELGNPQHLVATQDQLLIGVFNTGEILVIEKGDR